VRGFLTALLDRPDDDLGSIQDGLTGDYSLLAIKSTLTVLRRWRWPRPLAGDVQPWACPIRVG
jgi:hypothetical protein